MSPSAYKRALILHGQSSQRMSDGMHSDASRPACLQNIPFSFLINTAVLHLQGFDEQHTETEVLLKFYAETHWKMAWAHMKSSKVGCLHKLPVLLRRTRQAGSNRFQACPNCHFWILCIIEIDEQHTACLLLTSQIRADRNCSFGYGSAFLSYATAQVAQ